jgi:hypothetical protein
VDHRQIDVTSIQHHNYNLSLLAISSIKHSQVLTQTRLTALFLSSSGLPPLAISDQRSFALAAALNALANAITNMNAGGGAAAPVPHAPILDQFSSNDPFDLSSCVGSTPPSPPPALLWTTLGTFRNHRMVRGGTIVANIGRFAQVLVILTFRNRRMVRGGIIVAKVGSIAVVLNILVFRYRGMVRGVSSWPVLVGSR